MAESTRGEGGGDWRGEPGGLQLRIASVKRGGCSSGSLLSSPCSEDADEGVEGGT